MHATEKMMMVTGLLLAAAAGAGRVETAPVPDGEALATEYEVVVEGQPVGVYRARTLDEPFAGKQWNYGGPYAFANFAMDGPVTVRIRATRSLRNVVVRPLSYGLAAEHVDDNTITLALDRPRKVSIEPDGVNGPLLLFANPPEVDRPEPDAPGVLYFGPGVHKPEKIELGSNRTLYVAAGAVVKAEVLVKGDNVRICGRGILDGSEWAWRTGPVGNMIAIRDSRNVVVEDVTIRGSSHWTIVPRDSRDITIRNVKLCNSRVQNDDGINPCNSRNVRITDCFIRSDDDCVAMKGLSLDRAENNVEDIVVENSTLWCDRARIFLLGHESRAEFMRNITLKNLDIIHFTMTAFLFEPGEEMRLENVTVEDVRIHGEGQHSLVRLKPVVNQYMHNKVPGYVANVTFRNVTVDGAPGDYLLELVGADAEHTVSGVSFEGVAVRGQALTAESPNVRVGDHASAIGFKTP